MSGIVTDRFYLEDMFWGDCCAFGCIAVIASRQQVQPAILPIRIYNGRVQGVDIWAVNNEFDNKRNRIRSELIL